MAALILNACKFTDKKWIMKSLLCSKECSDESLCEKIIWERGLNSVKNIIQKIECE